MTPERWEQVKDLFERLEGATVEERERALAEVEDQEVAAEAARLLAIDAGSTLEVDRLRPKGDWVQSAVELRGFREGDLAAGRFRIVKFIAAGGMGEVYEAEDLELQERVAVKTLRQELTFTESALARFKQEIQLSRKVTHPNVCRIHDLWQHTREGGRVVRFLTMELLEGETLAEKLEREGPLAPEAVLEIVRPMVEGLEAAHAAGVIHRDLKPGNVMLTASRVVITDFGLSRSLHAAGVTISGSTLGTPAYMAPEQIENAATSPATDIYSLGVVMYEMLTGVVPFRGGSAMAVAVKKLRETPAPPSSLAQGVTPRWDRAVLVCLAQDPVMRFASARVLLTALEDETAKMPALPPRPVTARLWRGAFFALLLALAAGEYWRFRPVYRPAPEAERWYQSGVTALQEESPFQARQLLEKSIAVDGRYAAAHARLAQAYAELDMPDRAREELLRAADLPGREEVVVEAVRKFVLRDFGEAASLFRKLEPGTGAMLDTARAMARARDVAGARERYLAVLQTEPENGAAWLQLGGLEERARALEAYEKAGEVFRLRGNLEGLTAVALRRSETLVLMKNLEQSEAELRAVAEMARATGNVYLETEATAQLSRVAALAGRFGEARETAGKVRELARANGYGNLRVRSLYDLGFAYLAQFNYKEAEPLFREALNIAGEGRLRYSAARAGVGLAQTLIRQGRPGEGLEYLREAEAYFRKAQYREDALKARIVRVDMRIEEGRNDEAYGEAKACLEEARRSGTADEVIAMLLRVGHMAIVRGDFPESYAVHREARAEYERTDRRSQYLQSLLNEARLRGTAGDIAEAEKLVTEAAKLVDYTDKTVTSKLHGVKAHLAIAGGRGEEAVAEAELAPGEPAVLLARALVAAGRYGAAEREARRALTGPASTHAEAQMVLAEALLLQKRPAAREAELAVKLAGETAQILTAARGALVWRAAAGTREADELVKQLFARATKTWTVEARLRLLERADLRPYLKKGDVP